MIELIKLAWQEIKEDPKRGLTELIGGTILIGTMAFIFYWALWIVCPCY